MRYKAQLFWRARQPEQESPVGERGPQAAVGLLHESAQRHRRYGCEDKGKCKEIAMKASRQQREEIGYTPE